MRPRRRGRLARNAGWAVLGSVVASPLGLAFSVLTARWLSVADNGVLQAALSLGLLSAMVTLAGWADGLVFGVRRLGHPPERLIADALANALAMIALLAGLAWWLRDPILAELLPGGSPTALALTVAFVGLLVVHRVLAAAARAVDRFPLWTTAVAAQQGLRVGGVALAWATLPPSTEAALAVVVGAEALAAGVLAVPLLRHTGLSVAFDLARWRRIAAFSAKALLQNLGLEVHERLDLFLLAALLADPEVLAVYGLAVALANRVRRLTAPIAIAAFPELAEREATAAARVAARVLRANTFLSVGIVAVLGAVAAPLLPVVFGEAYRPSVPLLLVLLGAVIALSGHRILSGWFSAMDRQGINVGILLTALAVNIGLNLWWIPGHGALGAAWASAVSYGLESAIALVWFHRASGLSLRAIALPEPGEVAGLVRRLKRRLGR